MSKFLKRSTNSEIMDDLQCSGKVVHQTLRELDFINQWLGGNTITLSGLKKLMSNKSVKAISIADIGCGSGDMLRLVNSQFGKDVKLDLTGIDANPNIIAFAQQQQTIPIIFITENVLDASFQNKKFDLVLATLFLHHFSNAELVSILKSLVRQVRMGIVINDLHRHPLAYYSIKWLTYFFSKSAMVKFDAPLSVLRGFSRKEWETILKEAGITNYTLQWKWAFRWQLIIPAS